MDGMKEKISRSINQVERWVEMHGYKGYEPFDGLSSFLRPLTFNSLFLERILQQAVRQSPINLRPLLGVKPKESTKGRGYMASGYLKMLRITQDQSYEQKATRCLEWLMQNKAPQYEHYSWGNHFPFSGRGGRLFTMEPIIVWTSLIGHAFLDAYEILENKRYLNVANSICEWILSLPRERTTKGTCLSYVAFKQTSIHNSSMLGAAMLARTAKFTGNAIALQVAKEAMEYSCSRQLSNGAWYYGEDPKYHWIDNFHTGYNLDSLKCYIDASNDRMYEKNLHLGLKFFKETFFEENGRPKYYHERVYPVDIQCASQAIETLACFSENDEESLALSMKVAKWTIDNMQDRKGYFYYRELPFKKVKIPMLHWGQATMYKALALLLSQLSK